MVRMIVASMALAAAPGAAHGACTDTALVRRLPGESTAAFATRIRPAGRELVHPAVEGRFAATAGDVVALYGTRSDGLTEGWVLTPELRCVGQYRRIPLPIQDISLMSVANPSFQVRAVLRANADRDADRELILILYARGVGPADERGQRDRSEEHNVAVFDRVGRRFVYRYPISAKLHDRPTAVAVRRRLRALGY
jgi:hypothetical protein